MEREETESQRGRGEGMWKDGEEERRDWGRREEMR